VFRFRPTKLRRRAGRPARVYLPGEAYPAQELTAARITFVGLNLLFLAANIADAAYLWYGFKLPVGLTYSEFAHHGSYRLIVAVVLSAGVIAIFFRPAALAAKGAFARFLAGLFVVQNLAVLIGAARRLQIYVGAYGLTRFRVAAFIWMLIVAVGYVTIAVKLRRNLRVFFLLRANAVSVALILSATSLANIDGFIARWNVARYEAGSHAAVDLAYLEHLGLCAAPAIRRLAESDDDTALQAEAVLHQVWWKYESEGARWQSWTLYHHMALRQSGYVPSHARSGPSNALVPETDATERR
jgi:hypothetical protein